MTKTIDTKFELIYIIYLRISSWNALWPLIVFIRKAVADDIKVFIDVCV